MCIHADSRFPCCCSSSPDWCCNFCPDFAIDFSGRPLRLLLRKRESLPPSRNCRPKIYSPINMSHEPGVKGVIRARKPRIIQIIPIDFFTICFIWFIRNSHRFLCAAPAINSWLSLFSFSAGLVNCRLSGSSFCEIWPSKPGLKSPYKSPGFERLFRLCKLPTSRTQTDYHRGRTLRRTGRCRKEGTSRQTYSRAWRRAF